MSAFDANRSITQILYTQESLSHAPFSKFLQKFHGDKFAISPMIAEVLSQRDNPHQAFAIVQQFSSNIYNLTAENTAGQWVLALEKVRDSGNLGTIIRTFRACFGRNLILIDDCVDEYSREVVRASMGNFFDMEYFNTTSGEFSNWLKDSKLFLSTTSSHGGVNYAQAPNRKPHVLLMGNEQNGISEKLAQLSQQQLQIPMNPQVESLNLAVATGILLFSLNQGQ